MKGSRGKGGRKAEAGRHTGIVIPALVLKRQLAMRGWSQADLAKASGVSPTTISAIVTGENYHVAAHVARRLGDALQHQPVVLAFLEGAAS